MSVRAPGVADAACYPYSRHDGGDQPAEEPIEIVDRDGVYVDGEIECSGTMSSEIGEFAEAPLEGTRVPLDVARAAINGVGDDDQVFHVGYPEQPDPKVGVRRDGQVVATFSFVTFDGDEWVIEGSSVCESSGIR